MKFRSCMDFRQKAKTQCGNNPNILLLVMVDRRYGNNSTAITAIRDTRTTAKV